MLIIFKALCYKISKRKVKGDRMSLNDVEGFLTGKLLVAMPYSQDIRSANSVIYVCGHDDTGAMGLLINRRIDTISFEDLLDQLEIVSPIGDIVEFPVHYGGPAEIGRGFVLHSNDYFHDSTVQIDDDFSLTATMDVLAAISAGEGPSNALIALGYTGWHDGQLEQEIQENEWIIVEPTADLIFHDHIDTKWRQALASIGVDPNILSIQSGRA